jgi:3-hydroxyacyl-CoA dehydrogenase/3a,7a,12a-trihydroxy-5b-cholest-24-enoyl-CoA hydratase
LGIHGLTLTLAKEGDKRNIKVNTIAPIAASRMTENILPKAALENLKPDYVVPLVVFLAHESCNETGTIFELGAGFIAKLRWERS